MKAEDCFIYSANLVPSQLYPWYLLGKLYDETNNPEKLCEIARIIQEKEAKVHFPTIEDRRQELKTRCNKYNPIISEN